MIAALSIFSAMLSSHRCGSSLRATDEGSHTENLVRANWRSLGIVETFHKLVTLLVVTINSSRLESRERQ